MGLARDQRPAHKMRLSLPCRKSSCAFQHELFNLGSILATLPEDVHPRQARITDAEIVQLESEMDQMNAELPSLRSFVLPWRVTAERGMHVCRTVAAGPSRRW